MKKILFLLFFSPLLAHAQDARVLLNKADSCYNAKNYVQAALYADQFQAIDTTCDGCTYNAACYHALAGNKEKAVYYLKRSFKLGYAAKYLEQDDDLVSLHDLPEWPSLQKTSAANYEAAMKRRAIRDKEIAARYIASQQDMEKQYRVTLATADTLGTAQQVYQQLKSFNHYKQPATINRYLFLYHTINDSTKAPYTVLLPASYDPHKSYPLLVVLHGAVRVQESLPAYADSSITRYYHRHFTKYATEANMIMVFPFGSSKYNWMYPDAGFSVTPAVIRYLKQLLNIDDNEVYVTGHSNGATGSFSYLIKQPSLFAGFSGMNTQPRVRTGGTFLLNARNRSFYNIATDLDYYYPPAANDSLNLLAHQLHIPWTVDMHKGYPHWFPQFDTADIPVKKMFASMLSFKRNPFHPQLYWECDNIEYGSCDWLSITKLDTTKQAAAWQHQYNFTIPYWLDNMNTGKVIDSSSIAFGYPRRSGAVQATYKQNTFTLESSRVQSLRIYLSPAMIDFSKPVTVYLDGKKVFDKKVQYNKTFMIRNFSQNFDRKAVWVGYIDINK
ncbi:MAG: hypothetical protein QM731_22360 [Chitinophagaceae bacterium]